MLLASSSLYQSSCLSHSIFLLGMLLLSLIRRKASVHLMAKRIILERKHEDIKRKQLICEYLKSR
jgi:hypothetical protein